MITLVNFIKALLVCVLVSGAYTLFTSTRNYQQLLEGEGQHVGKIEALMHYSTLIDVWSRMLSGWLPLLAVSVLSCVILMTWIKVPLKS